MAFNFVMAPALSREELRGCARAVAAVEWVLLTLVLAYLLVLAPEQETRIALSMAMFLFAAFILAFHYINLYGSETPAKLTIEALVMIAFITCVLYYTGRLESPLLNLYLLPVITGALALGRGTALILVVLVAGCHVFLGYHGQAQILFPHALATRLVVEIAPLALVAYVTTILAADIRGAMAQIKLLAETDDLTGMLNRRGVSAVATRLYKQAARYKRPFSVLMLDADDLKSVNDAYGHDTGDRMLQLTVHAIRDELRESDIVARYGGDEILVLLPETPCSGAAGVANRLRHRVESTPVPVGERMVTGTFSVGVACYPDHGPDFESVLRQSDEALAAAKRQGKNRFMVADSIPRTDDQADRPDRK